MQNKIMFNNPPTAAAAAPKKRRPRKKVEMPQDEEAERQERELRMKIAQSLHTQQVMRTEVELEDNAAHRLSSGSGGDGVGGGNNNNNNKEVMPDGFIRFMAQEQRVDMGMMLPPQDRQYLQHQQNNNGGQWEDENGGGGGGGDNNYPYSRGNSGGSGHGRGYHGNNNHNMYHNNGQMTERQPNWNSNNEGQHLQNRHEDFGNKITREEILLSLKHEQERLLTEALKLKAMVENRVHQQQNHHPQQQQQQPPPPTRNGFSPAPGYSQSSSPGLYNQSPSPDNIDRMYQRNNSNEYNPHYTTSPSPGGDTLQHPNNTNSINNSNNSNFNQQYNPHPASPSPVADRMQHANNNTNNFNQQDFNGIQHQHNNNGNNNIFTNDQNQQYNSINGYPNQYNNNSNNNLHHQQQCQISSRTQAPKDTRGPGTPTICNVTGNNNALNKEQQQQFRQQMQQFNQELHQQLQQEQHQQQQAGHTQEMPQPSQSRWQQDQQQRKPASANKVNDEHKNSLTMEELHSLLTQQQQQKIQCQRETGHNQEMPQQTQSRWQQDQQQRKPASANKVNDEHKNSLTTKDLHSLLSSGQGLTANSANSGPYQDQQQPNPPFSNNGNHEASKEFEILMSGSGMTASGLTSIGASKSIRSSMFHSVGTITSSFQSSMQESLGSLVFEPEGESPNKTPDGVMLGPVEEEGTLDFSDRKRGSDYESRCESDSTNNVSHGGNGNLTTANAARTKGDSNCTVVNVNTAEVTEIESKPSQTDSEDDVMNSLMASAMNRSLMDSNLLGDSKYMGDNMGASSKSIDFMMSMDSLAFHDFKKSDMNMSLSDLIEEDDADLSSGADVGNAKGSKGQMFRKPPPSRGSAARGSETSSITMENVNGKTLRESKESHGSSISTSCRSLRSQASKRSVVDQQTMMSEISQWTSSNPFDNSLSGNMDLANAPDSRGQEGRQRDSINKRIFDFNDFESFNGSVDDFNLSLMSSVTETDLNNSLKALDLDPTRSIK